MERGLMLAIALVSLIIYAGAGVFTAVALVNAEWSMAMIGFMFTAYPLYVGVLAAWRLNQIEVGRVREATENGLGYDRPDDEHPALGRPTDRGESDKDRP